MSVAEGLLLGMVQGIAEFLPISSSGHLMVVQQLLSLGDVPLLFDVFLHLATLAAVVLFFRKKILSLFAVFFRWVLHRPPMESLEREQEERRYIVAVLLATLVTGVIGLAVEKKLKNLSIQFIFIGFLVTAVFLVLSSVLEKKRKSQPAGTSISWWQGLVIGFAQGVGTLPGVSRSGSTIAGALLSGVTRETAGEFSFIASIPAILGAFILEAKDLGSVSSSVGFVPVVAGCVAAFATGYAALYCLMKIIRRGHLEWFALYLVPVGVLGLLIVR